MRKLIVFGALLALAAALIGCGKKHVENSSDRESRSVEEARKLIACVDAALMSYNMKHGGNYPDSLNALTDKSDPLLKGDLVDPWGHELMQSRFLNLVRAKVEGVDNAILEEEGPWSPWTKTRLSVWASSHEAARAPLPQIRSAMKLYDV